MAILVIEQNIGVATAVSDRVAIMVNGRVNRMMDAEGAGRRPRIAAAAAGRRPAFGRGAGDAAAAAQAAEQLAEVYRIERAGADGGRAGAGRKRRLPAGD